MRECAVLAVEDANRLMTLAAFVALHDAARRAMLRRRELQRFVKSRLMPYKYPREVVYVAELPKTGTGKIDRQAIKRQRAS